MPEQTSEFFADIPAEGDKAEIQPEESQPSKETEVKKDESDPPPAEKEQADADAQKKPVQDNALPFHKHPAWMRQISKNKALEKQLEELRRNIEAAPTKAKQEEAVKEVPPELRDIFGENADAYGRFEKHYSSRMEKQFQELLNRREEEQKKQSEQAEKLKTEATALYEERLAELGEELGLPLHEQGNNERNQILDIVSEYGVIDAQGYPDFKKANELRLKLYPAKGVSDERKRVAANAGKANLSDAPPASDEVITPSKLRKISLDSFFR